MRTLKSFLKLLTILLLIQASISANSETEIKTVPEAKDPIPVIKDDLTAAEKQKLIRKMIELIDERFVDIPAGKKVIKGLNKNLKEGKYDKIITESEFIRVINKDLYTLSRDLHLSVRPISGGQNSNGRRRMRTPGSGGRMRSRPEGGRFSAQILDGEIGYVKVNGLLAPLAEEGVREDMEKALQKVKDADAVIFDLRNVRGGVPETMSLLSSYLYDEKPKLLNTYHNRLTGPNKLFTKPDKVSFHFGLKKPLYALINGRTASGGESFTYVNQQHGRFVVVGETSRGAGRLSPSYPISETLNLVVPENRSEHPVSKTGFEKIGVKPDVEAKSEESLSKAHFLALKKLLETDENNSKWKTALAKFSVEKKTADEKPADKKLSQYAGSYGTRKILLSEGGLLYRNEGNEQPDLVLEEIGKTCSR